MNSQTVSDWLLLFQLETTCLLYRDVSRPVSLTPNEHRVLSHCLDNLTYPPIHYLNFARIEILLDTHWSQLSPVSKWLSVLRLCIVAAIIDPHRWPAQKNADAAILVLTFPFNDSFGHELYDGYQHYFDQLSNPLSIEAACAAIQNGYKLWSEDEYCG